MYMYKQAQLACREDNVLMYMFYCHLGITEDGEKEEYVNESYCYSELDLYVPILKLVERQGNQGEKLLNAEISNLIGRRLHDFDVMGPEVMSLKLHYQMISLVFNVDSLF